MWLRLEPLVLLGAPMCFSPFPFAALCRRYLIGIVSLALVFFLPTFWLLVVAVCGCWCSGFLPWSVANHGSWHTANSLCLLWGVFVSRFGLVFFGHFVMVLTLTKHSPAWAPVSHARVTLRRMSESGFLLHSFILVCGRFIYSGVVICYEFMNPVIPCNASCLCQVANSWHFPTGNSTRIWRTCGYLYGL